MKWAKSDDDIDAGAVGVISALHLDAKPTRATVRYAAGSNAAGKSGAFKLKIRELMPIQGGRVGEDGFVFVPKVVR